MTPGGNNALGPKDLRSTGKVLQGFDMKLGLLYFERENMKWDDRMDGPIHPEITEDNHLEERFC